jgi:hypothetical protein
MPNELYDKDKVDEVSLALLYLTLGEDGRAWKGMDWDVSDRLYAKGWIENPRSKNKSLVLTPEGRVECIRLFQKHFGKHSGANNK